MEYHIVLLSELALERVQIGKRFPSKGHLGNPKSGNQTGFALENISKMDSIPGADVLRQCIQAPKEPR